MKIGHENNGLGSARVSRVWFRRLAETISPEAYASRLRREMEEKVRDFGTQSPDTQNARATRAKP